jgi:rubrerythrin
MDTIIKLKSEISEHTQDIKFARKQLERLENSQKKISIRQLIRDKQKHRVKLGKLLDSIKYL